MSDALFAFVVNAVWQSTLIAGLGLALARFLPAARARFELLALTLVAAVAAPALTFAPRVATIAPIDFAPLQNRGTSVLAIAYFTGLGIVALRFLIAAVHARRLAFA